MVFYMTWYVRYDENTSNDTSAQHFRTKHSLLIFDLQETLYFLNVASKNRMPHFRRHGLGTWGRIREDYITKIGNVFTGCGKWGEKKADGPKEHEGLVKIN
jgi:hypothetical protein